MGKEVTMNVKMILPALIALIFLSMPSYGQDYNNNGFYTPGEPDFFSQHHYNPHAQNMQADADAYWAEVDENKKKYAARAKEWGDNFLEHLPEGSKAIGAVTYAALKGDYKGNFKNLGHKLCGKKCADYGKHVTYGTKSFGRQNGQVFLEVRFKF